MGCLTLCSRQARDVAWRGMWRPSGRRGTIGVRPGARSIRRRRDASLSAPSRPAAELLGGRSGGLRKRSLGPGGTQQEDGFGTSARHFLHHSSRYRQLGSRSAAVIVRRRWPSIVVLQRRRQQRRACRGARRGQVGRVRPSRGLVVVVVVVAVADWKGGFVEDGWSQVALSVAETNNQQVASARLDQLELDRAGCSHSFNSR